MTNAEVAAGHDGQAVAALERAELACISSRLAGDRGVLRNLSGCLMDIFVFVSFKCFYCFFIDCLLLFLIFMDLLMVMFDVLSGFLMEVADDFCMAICVLQYHVGKTITNHPFRKGLYHLFLVIGRMDIIALPTL